MPDNIHKPKIMKILFFATIFSLCSAAYAQDVLFDLAEAPGNISDGFGKVIAVNESGHLNSLPPPPVLTSNASQLEVCTGRNTTLTASSDYIIDWYITPPPLGTPVGRGAYFVTPTLTTGYYTYYAIASNGFANSNISAMEVVMVYPLPTVTVSSSADILCAGEPAVLTAKGTSFYNWQNGFNTASIAISPTATITYTVIGTSMAGCSDSFSYTQQVEDCTGINDKAAGDPKPEPQVIVYPNPTRGEFNITVNSVSENIKAEIYNSLGEQVYSSRIRAELTPVTLKNLPDGIYIVIIAENAKILSRHKVIKE